MDPETIFERADVIHQPGDLLPGESDAPKWLATDPETECKGVGDFEQAARTNLVYAVQAYHEDPEGTTPFLSAGKGRTSEMRWRDTDETAVAERLTSLLPF